MDTLGIKSIAEQRNLPEVKSGEVAKYFKQLPSTKNMELWLVLWLEKKLLMI